MSVTMLDSRTQSKLFSIPVQSRNVVCVNVQRATRLNRESIEMGASRSLPAFSFPAVPFGQALAVEQARSAGTTEPSSPRRQHRRSAAVSTSRTRDHDSKVQTYPPVPPLPTDLSLLPRPSLSKPTPRLRFASVDDSVNGGTFLLAPSPCESPVTPSSPVLAASDNAVTPTRSLSLSNISDCPTLLSDNASATTTVTVSSSSPTFSIFSPSTNIFSLDPSQTCEEQTMNRKRANRKAHVIPLLINTDDLRFVDGDLNPQSNLEEHNEVEEDDDDDNEFFSCRGTSLLPSSAVAEWVRKCSASAGPEEENLQPLEGGWVRAL